MSGALGPEMPAELIQIDIVPAFIPAASATAAETDSGSEIFTL